jgi:superfamily II DNA or RNA helicase
VVKYNNFLGLTASFERQDGRHDLILNYTKIVDNIPLSEGLKNGWVDEFTIIKVPVTLTKKEQNKLDNINEEYQEVVTALPGKNPLKSASFFISYLDLKKWVIGKKTKQVKFIKGLEKKFEANHIPKKDWNKWIDDYFIRPTTTHEYFQNALLAKKFYKLVGQRKSLLYNVEDKLKKTLILAEKYDKEYKFILSREIKFIKEVQKLLPKNTSKMYHSKLSKKDNDTNFDIFDDGRTKVRTLLSVKALNEGVNIPKLSTLIISSYTATVLDKIQIFGRALRKYKNKKVTMIYLYVPNTQEEKWLNTILANEKVLKLKL